MLKGDGDSFKLNLLHSYQDQLYAAVCFSVLNSLEKILRMSLVGGPSPYTHFTLHPLNDMHCRACHKTQDGRVALTTLMKGAVNAANAPALGVRQAILPPLHILH